MRHSVPHFTSKTSTPRPGASPPCSVAERVGRGRGPAPSFRGVGWNSQTVSKDGMLGEMIPFERIPGMKERLFWTIIMR